MCYSYLSKVMPTVHYLDVKYALPLIYCAEIFYIDKTGLSTCRVHTGQVSVNKRLLIVPWQLKFVYQCPECALINTVNH